MSEGADVSEDGSGGRGSRFLRALAIVLVALLVLYVLFFHVFPRVERYLEDPTLGAPALTVAYRG